MVSYYNPKESPHCIICVDEYLVEFARQKVRDANGGQLVRPILNTDISKLEEGIGDINFNDK